MFGATFALAKLWERQRLTWDPLHTPENCGLCRYEVRWRLNNWMQDQRPSRLVPRSVAIGAAYKPYEFAA